MENPLFVLIAFLAAFVLGYATVRVDDLLPDDASSAAGAGLIPLLGKCAPPRQSLQQPCRAT